MNKLIKVYYIKKFLNGCEFFKSNNGLDTKFLIWRLLEVNLAE